MTFAAEIVIRKNNSGYVAGFASRTTGTKVESFGKWYGSQMGYRPFRAALAAAEARAAELNATERAKARVIAEAAGLVVYAEAHDCTVWVSGLERWMSAEQIAAHVAEMEVAHV